MSKSNSKITINIDNKSLKVEKGTTILDAAERNDIYIPSLCAHPELAPYGGCRLCIVEVDGMPAYPTACTTLAEEAMVVRTHTETLQQMRRQVLQLILSEHPSSCLICDEAKDCSEYQETIRKVGVTTGCRWCPKDGNCQLQDVADYLEIDSIDLPVYYRALPVEKDDPFYDRDYNLCIYCGRCVRICDEHRKSCVLTLKQRGRFTTIGPAFNLSHIEAGCEFCGACVSVCPTGALSEKSRKWSGVPETHHRSFCPLCSLNCDIQILTKKNKVMGTLPPARPLSAGGELCVRGRFCLNELVNHPDRILVPQYRSADGIEQLSWDEAAEKITEHIKGVKPDRVAFYLSPSLTLEDLAAVKQFTDKVIETDNLTTSILSSKLAAFLPLTTPSVGLEEIDSSDCIVSVFLNGNYNYAPVSLAIKRAAEKGIRYYQIGWMQDTTSRFAANRFLPPAGREKEFFKKIVQALEKSTAASREIKEFAETMKNCSSAVIILGTWILDLTDWQDILDVIEKIKALTGCKVLAPYPYGNPVGLLSVIDLKLNEQVDRLIDEGKIDVLFLVGEYPFHNRPAVDFIIYQGCFPPPEEPAADMILPAAMWPEFSGSYADMKGKRKKFKAVTKAGGAALRHGRILAKIAKAMGKKDLKFTQKALSKYIPAELLPTLPDAKPKSTTRQAISAPNKSFPYLLIQESSTHIFDSTSLSKVITDMGRIAPEDTIVMNPADARQLNLHSGLSVVVESNNRAKVYPVMLRKIVSPGFVYLATSCKSFVFDTNPCPVRLRRSDV